MEGNHSQTAQSLFFTVTLGIYFTILQAYEYIEAPFTIADSVYGSTFFIAIRFHGIHVLIGNTFLLLLKLKTCLSRQVHVLYPNLRSSRLRTHLIKELILFQ